MSTVYSTVYSALLNAACSRLKQRYVMGIFKWAEDKRKDLSDKERKLATALNRLMSANASPKVFKALLDQWEESVDLIITEWERMLRRL